MLETQPQRLPSSTLKLLALLVLATAVPPLLMPPLLLLLPCAWMQMPLRLSLKTPWLPPAVVLTLSTLRASAVDLAIRTR